MRWIVLVGLAGCGGVGEGAPVRANLSDGQILSGDLRTDVLALETAMGEVEIPLEDVGEVVPTEAGALGEADGKVTVWLRNGSEFVGTWAEPELTVGIEVGGEDHDVALPMNKLARLQTRAGEVWPEGTAYRVHTLYGDDFLVDPEHTRLVVESDLGTFSPLLSECVTAKPIAEATGEWRLELDTGTVLVGKLADDAIAFALPLGPDELTVSLRDFAWMERVAFAAPPPPPRQRWLSLPEAQAPAAAPATAGSGATDEWFDNSALRSEKVEQLRR